MKTVILILFLLIIITNSAFNAEADTTKKAWLEVGFGIGKVNEVTSEWSTKFALLDKEKIYSIHYIDFDTNFGLIGPVMRKERSRLRYYNVSVLGVQYGICTGSKKLQNEFISRFVMHNVIY